MSVVRFDIPGRPVPWKRIRTKGKQRYPDKGQVAAKAAVVHAFNAARANGPAVDIAQAVALSVHAVFALPQRPGARRMGCPHIQTPDADNIAKLVKDALNGVAFVDDRQVCELRVRKQWSDHNRTSVTVEYIDPLRGRSQ